MDSGMMHQAAVGAVKFRLGVEARGIQQRLI